MDYKFMEEKQLIKQLKSFKTIKPNNDWVNLTRTKIIGKAKASHGISNWNHVVIGRPAWVLASLIIVGIGLAGSLVYLNSKQAPIIVFDNIQGFVAKIASQGQSNEQVVSSLGDMQIKLENIKASLNNLKNIKDQNQALAMAEVVRATAERGEATVESIKKNNGSLSKQVLASLASVGQLSKELKEKSHILQQELFEQYLKDLQQKNLSDADRQRLEKAEEYYKNDQVAEAMILISKIEN